MTKRLLIVIATLLISGVETLSQKKPSILDLIEQSIPKRESDWKLKTSDRMEKINVPQASMDWTNGTDEVGAYILVFPTVAAAADNLKLNSGDGQFSKLDGTGDEAYKWTHQENRKDTQFIIRFRKTGVVVMMSSASLDVVKRGARYIAESIPPLDQYLQIVPQSQNQGDTCHVYVVDAVKARRAFEDHRSTGNEEADNKAIAGAQTVFPEFRTVIGEEALTTKTYGFPHNKFIITASVYYTDESMASSKGVDSMLVGIAVSPTAQKDAISADNNAVSEVTLNGRDTVRVKKYVRVKGRLYVVGLECKGQGLNELQ